MTLKYNISGKILFAHSFEVFLKVSSDRARDISEILYINAYISFLQKCYIITYMYEVIGLFESSFPIAFFVSELNISKYVENRI
jgi:hypothetical protein